MKKKGIRLAAVIAVIFAMSMAMPTASFAAGDQGYLALGDNLSESEKATVMDLLGISSTDGYEVFYVTNAEEHQYLGQYVSSSEIGTRALSSVLITPNGGSDINVTTKNINYCTVGMYRNALTTAGVSGVDVLAVGPFELSGTSALVGTIKAYERMSGEDVSDEVIEGSVGEMITTGEVGEAIGDKEKAEAIIATVKEEMANNPNMSDSEIQQSIQEAANDAGVELSDENISDITNMFEELQGLDIDWNNVKKQSESILENFKDIFQSEEAQGFIHRIIAWFKSLF